MYLYKHRLDYNCSHLRSEVKQVSKTYLVANSNQSLD